MTDHELTAEAWAAAERDRLRRVVLERLYAALAVHFSNPITATWRPVIEAFRAVGKPPAEDVTERLKSEQP